MVSLLTQLQSLNLTDCPFITDAGPAHVSTLSQLQSLRLSDCRLISDAGLAHVSTLTLLRSPARGVLSSGTETTKRSTRPSYISQR